ncbi:helix-turn-helix domain-containing protein [Nonomuraea turcica]|uniref:helix-turn-helix domain-containing protein n=1 Tax=Nonomuraea sp. G32 TaxID=3067274 RepID=UPI00273BEF62|nr:helix-turn-helix domain-containing protein [Nonomuraea sp. G32]MDP4511827.1 helix-turn-helix domain-containing protein [Nonomuraea sp. G32]
MAGKSDAPTARERVIAERIQRALTGKSDKELQAALGWSSSQVGRAKRGEMTNPTAKTMGALQTLFPDVPLGYWAGESAPSGGDDAGAASDAASTGPTPEMYVLTRSIGELDEDARQQIIDFTNMVRRVHGLPPVDQ